MTGYRYNGQVRDTGLDLEAANAAIMNARDTAGARVMEAHPQFEWPAVRAGRLAATSVHGTDAGYKRHQKHHTATCVPCRLAHNAANGKRARR